MDIYFHITKTGNLFHFISNLTDWHFSVRRSYKVYWIEKTGELSTEDKEWLKKAENLFQKYTFGEKYWGHVFLRRPDDDVWETATKFFGEKDTKRFKDIADYFMPRFEKLWDEEEKLLNDWVSILKDSKNDFLKPGINNDLDTLFNTKADLSSGIKIVLLMSSPSTLGGGGANIDRGAVTTELSRMEHENKHHVWLNFWHEISHVFWERTSYYMTMLNEFIDKKENKPNMEKIDYKTLIKEGVLESFIPDGYLAEKYFDKKINHSDEYEQNMQGWRQFCQVNLYDIAKEYVESEKKIDKQYLEAVHENLEEFIKKHN